MVTRMHGGGELGVRLRTLRQAKGVTLEALARELGVHFTTISAWERGRTSPDYTQLHRLAERFGVRVGELLGETVSGKPRLRMNAWPAARWKEYMNRTEALQLALAVLEAQPQGPGCGVETVAGSLQGQRATLADLLRVAACYEVEGVEKPASSLPAFPPAEERIRGHLRHLPGEIRPSVEALLLEWLELFGMPANASPGEKQPPSPGRPRRRLPGPPPNSKS